MGNFFEFAFGWDPTLAEPHGSGLSVPEVRPSPPMEPAPIGTGSIELRFRRRIDHRLMGLVYTVESSSELTEESWFPSFGQITSPPEPTGDGITEVVTMQVFNEATAGGGDPSASSGFFRVRASHGGNLFNQ